MKSLNLEKGYLKNVRYLYLKEFKIDVFLYLVILK